MAVFCFLRGCVCWCLGFDVVADLSRGDSGPEPASTFDAWSGRREAPGLVRVSLCACILLYDHDHLIRGFGFKFCSRGTESACSQGVAPDRITISLWFMERKARRCRNLLSSTAVVQRHLLIQYSCAFSYKERVRVHLRSVTTERYCKRGTR